MSVRYMIAVCLTYAKTVIVRSMMDLLGKVKQTNENPLSLLDSFITLLNTFQIFRVENVYIKDGGTKLRIPKSNFLENPSKM